jgi:hypothetical protein
MSTITETIQPSQYLDSIDNLSKILDQYANWNNDSLTEELYDWGANLISFVHDRMPNNIENISHIAQEQLNTLVNHILLNPIHQTMFNHPVLERDVTWDTSTHDLVMKFFTNSPFDSKPMIPTSELKPHLFAQAIIDWINHLSIPECKPFINQPEVDIDCIKALADFPQWKIIPQMMIHLLIDKKKDTEGKRKVAEELKSDGDYEKFVEETEERVENLIKTNEENFQKNAEEIQERIDSINQTYEQRLKAMKQEQDVEFEKNHQEVNALHQKIDQLDQNETDARAELNSRITLLQLSHEQRIVDLNHKMELLKLEHEKNIQELQAKLEAQKQASDIAIASLKAQHAIEMANLHKLIDEKNTKIQELTTQLKNAQKEAQDLKQETQGLKITVKSQQAEIVELRNRVDDDGGSCSIM